MDKDRMTLLQKHLEHKLLLLDDDMDLAKIDKKHNPEDKEYLDGYMLGLREHRDSVRSILNNYFYK
jgi:hypothetical protein